MGVYNRAIFRCCFRPILSDLTYYCTQLNVGITGCIESCNLDVDNVVAFVNYKALLQGVSSTIVEERCHTLISCLTG